MVPELRDGAAPRRVARPRRRQQRREGSWPFKPRRSLLVLRIAAPAAPLERGRQGGLVARPGVSKAE
jgi:hypothetical protein